MDERNQTRAKILGVLIRDARLHAKRTVDQCAAVLNITPEQMAAAEAGSHVISLPELEVLAIFLDVPMAHFWGSETLSDEVQPDYRAILQLRHKIVGGLLRHARLEAGLSLDEVATAVDLDAAQVEAYEIGKKAIPFLQLERLGEQLNVPIDYFLDDGRGPLQRHEARQEQLRRFEELPADIQAFVLKPTNVSYLQTAMRLSEMDAEQLRGIATALLEITY